MSPNAVSPRTSYMVKCPAQSLRCRTFSLRRILRDNGLSIVLLGLFLVSWAGQSVVGWLANNEELSTHHQPQLSYFSYLLSAHFVEGTAENWESEFLQMGVFVILTVFLFQRGSAESKRIDEKEEVDRDPRRSKNNPNAPWPVRRGGWVLGLYSYSLTLAFLLLFLASVAVHAISGAKRYSQEQIAHGQPAVSATQYLGTSQFWFESLQNWQSEFLAIASMVILSIYLRQKGSPESKPVDAPHSETGR